MKKRNLRSKFRILKFLDQRELGSLPRSLICSVSLVLFFYSMPIIIKFSNKKNLAIENNSKKILAYTLKKQKNGVSDDDQIVNEKELLLDIFSLNDLETDTVRLNESTIKQLFEETNYTLQDVREKELVKPVA